MTLRFAAARTSTASPLARALVRKGPAQPTNDNAVALAGQAELCSELRAALLHFAAHGLGAARTARGEAELAHAAGNEASYRYWLGICHTLDRRMAGRLVRRHAPLVGEPAALAHT
ncbi:hypothetical protein ACWPM1_04145 [Tsuneonella sp. HG249]|jgi:hypothetical protein